MTTEPKLQIWDINKVVPYEKNAKKHPDEQIEKLATSIRELGWTSPITVDRKGMIIGGHGRRLAALKLGLKKVPVIVRDDLTDEQAMALRLADNRVVSTDYDTLLLQEELAELHMADFDLSILGFDEKELSFLIDELDMEFVDAVTDDVTAALDEQKAAHEEAFREVGQREVPIAQALGFKTITGDKERVVARFIAQLEIETGKKGAEALVTFIEGLQEAA